MVDRPPRSVGGSPREGPGVRLGGSHLPGSGPDPPSGTHRLPGCPRGHHQHCAARQGTGREVSRPGHRVRSERRRPGMLAATGHRSVSRVGHRVHRHAVPWSRSRAGRPGVSALPGAPSGRCRCRFEVAHRRPCPSFSCSCIRRSSRGGRTRAAGRGARAATPCSGSERSVPFAPSRGVGTKTGAADPCQAL